MLEQGADAMAKWFAVFGQVMFEVGAARLRYVHATLANAARERSSRRCLQAAWGVADG